MGLRFDRWDRYFHRLVGLARQRLRASPRRTTDEEDVALSDFDSFCRNAEAGRFPDLADRDGLWHILAAFTLRKAAHHLRDAGRLKRGGGAIERSPELLDDVIGREPDSALAVEVAEECERLLARLHDPDLQRIVLLRMDGFTVEEVAQRVGYAPGPVKRKVHPIRSIWEQEPNHEPD